MQKKDNTISLTKYLINLYIICMFSFMWFSYYNNFAFRGNRELGGTISIIIYAIIYNYFARLYHALKIGSNRIGEIVFSQFLTIGLADIILYVECCLVANRYVPILPMIVMCLAQFIGAVLWALFAKRYFIQSISASDTLLIYGERNYFEFISQLLSKFGHLFKFTEIISYKDCTVEELGRRIDKHSTVMLYEVTGAMRTPLMEYCINRNKILYITPRIADIIIEGFEKRHLIDTPILKYEYNYLSTQKQLTKRLFDIAVAVVGIILTLLPMSIIALAIKYEDKGPILFKQKRYTKDGKVFEIYKFRSMIVDAESEGRPIPCKQQDNRITKVGHVIRRIRLDELPQFFNILKGDMSIVGPRPERVEHVEAYTKEFPEFTYRARVKAGLTGYAQIYGKYNTSPYEKLKLDLMYIENQSILLDLKILLLTIKTIFIPESTEGFNEEKSKLMEKRLNKVYEK